MQISSDEWVDTARLALELKVTEGHVREMAREGVIPSIRVGSRRRRFQLAAVVAALRPDLMEGLALLYPGIKARVRPTGFQRLQLKLAEKLGVREKRIEIPLSDPALFTGDVGWQSFIRNDPLVLHEVTVSFLLANQELDQLVEEAADRITRSLFCQLAGKDQIIDNRATEAWLQRVASTQKRLVSYPHARHTLEFEPQREQIVSDYAGWLAEFSASGKI